MSKLVYISSGKYIDAYGESRKVRNFYINPSQIQYIQCHGSLSEDNYGNIWDSKCKVDICFANGDVLVTHAENTQNINGCDYYDEVKDKYY